MLIVYDEQTKSMFKEVRGEFKNKEFVYFVDYITQEQSLAGNFSDDETDQILEAIS